MCGLNSQKHPNIALLFIWFFVQFLAECSSALMLRFISLLLVSGGGPNRVERVLDLFRTLMLHCPGRVSDNGSWSVRLSLPCYLDERPTGGCRLILTTQSLRRGHPLAFSLPLSNSDWGSFHFQIHSNQANDAISSWTACCCFFNLAVFWFMEPKVINLWLLWSLCWSPFEREGRSRSKTQHIFALEEIRRILLLYHWAILRCSAGLHWGL